MRAAAGGHDKAAASLLRLGAAPDLADRDGWTALMHAAAHPSSGSVRRSATSPAPGPPSTAAPGRRKTALMIAAEKGNELAADELLRSEPPRPPCTSGGKTALDFALAEGNKACAERLGYVEKRR